MTYKPKIIHYDGEGDPHWQFVERDVPTVTGQVFAANVEMLTDFDGNIVGFTIYEPQSPSPIVDEVAEARARALALLQAEDERQNKIHELLETIREQIRVDVAPEHRPEGLMTNIQNAVYAMRGRMRLMNDAAITSPLQPPSAALTSPPKAGAGEPVPVAWRTDIFESLPNGKLSRLILDAEEVTDPAPDWKPLYATPEPRGERDAPQCCMCGKRGLSTTEGDGGTECELGDGRWVCSQACYDKAVPMPDGDRVRVTDEMMERARAAYRSTQFYPIVPGNHDNALRAALEAALNPGGRDAR